MKQWLDTLYAEQGAPYCARESRGKDMRRDRKKKKKKKEIQREKERDRRGRENEIRREHRSEMKKG